MFDRQKDFGSVRYRKQSGKIESCLGFKKVVFESCFDSTCVLNLPQFVFAGRSNVGKSSLINAILHRKVAFVSKKPGKTVFINAIRVNDLFYLVDLPGYGYANRPKAQRQKWKIVVEEYLRSTDLISHIFVLVDSRHKPMQSDCMFIEWLRFYSMDFSVVFTKTDMATQKDIYLVVRYLRDIFGEFNYFITSVRKRRGIDELCGFIKDFFQT